MLAEMDIPQISPKEKKDKLQIMAMYHHICISTSIFAQASSSDLHKHITERREYLSVLLVMQFHHG
jgi:hypothetical protein